MSTNNREIIDVTPNHLNSLRRANKKSQKEMGVILGLEQGSYSGLERGASHLTKKQMLVLADEFDVNLNWLILDEGPMLLSDINIGINEMDAFMWLKDLDGKFDEMIVAARGTQGRLAELERRLAELEGKR